MYDGIQLLVNSKRHYKHLLKNHELFVIASNKTGEEKGLKVKSGNFFIHARESESQIIVKYNGSLHKYYHGKNDGIFTHKEICHAVDMFSKEYGLSPSDKHVIQKIEFGININARYPKGIVDSAMLYRGRTPYRNCKKRISYKEWCFDQYSVKLYQKSKDVIRLEIHIDEMRKIKNIAIEKIYDLKKIKCVIDCLSYLYSSINNFLFVPFDKEKLLRGKEEVDWNNYRADSFWENISKDRKYHHQKRANIIRKAYGLIDWSNYLKQGLILVANKIIGESGYYIDATNSSLGLLAETVARPFGSSDRQTVRVDQSDGASTYNGCINNIKGTAIGIVYLLSERLRAIVIVFGHLCRSPPRRQSIKRMF